MSAGARSCVCTPCFCITRAPRPKKRILMPFSSASDLISRRNQRVSGDGEGIEGDQAVLLVDLVAQLVAVAEDLPGEELAVARTEGHRGEERQRRVAPAWKPGVVQQASTVPLDAASKHSGPGTRALGSAADLEIAVRHLLDVLREALAGRPEGA